MSFRRFIAFWIVISLFLSTLGHLPRAHADTVLNLPAPGNMVNLSPAYEPALIKGLTVHKDNPFLFDFIVDTGNSDIAGDEIKKEGDRLVKYFFACLTIPEKDLWVNLSPYEKDRMIPQALGQTALGRDLLAQDYILKQLTASLIYPEKDLGKAFWDRVYAKAMQIYGTTQIPVNTFNKVWIVADKASVYEHGQTAFVMNGHLKVMLEEDYLALQKHSAISSSSTVIPAPSTNGRSPEGQAGIHNGPPIKTFGGDNVASQIVKAIILPELEKEVNTGKNFVTLRQIFNTLILATWYKKNLKEALLNQVYADKAKIRGIEYKPNDVEMIYAQYLKAYKKGVFNYIKEDAQPDGQTIPRKYFSGGFDSALVVTVDRNPADAAEIPGSTGKMLDLTVGINFNNSNHVANPAMTTSDAVMMKLIKTLYDKIPPERRVDWKKIEVRFEQIKKQVKQAVDALSLMISFAKYSGNVPTETEILASLVDTGVFHPALFNGNVQDQFGVGQDISPIFVFDGNIFTTYPGEKKPYRIALTLGKDFIAVRAMYHRPLAKGVVKFYQLGKDLDMTLKDKLRGMHNSKPLLQEAVDLAHDQGGDGTIFILNEGADFNQAAKKWVSMLGMNNANQAMASEKDRILSRVIGRFKGNQAAMEFVFKSIRDLEIDPATVQVVDGSSDDQKSLNERVAGNPSKNTAPSMEGTMMATEDTNDKKKYRFWKKSSEIKPKVWEKLKGSYKGKKVYVIPYLRQDKNLSFSQAGIQITDSPYVAIKMIQMAGFVKVGKVAIEHLNKQSDKTKFVRGIHSTGGLDNGECYFVVFPEKKDQEQLILSYGSDFGGDILVYGLNDQAQMAKGGIDLSTSGMKWNISKDGDGVEMNNDPAMIERIRREGIDGLSPVIFRITPVTSIWPLVGLQAPVKQEIGA